MQALNETSNIPPQCRLTVTDRDTEKDITCSSFAS